MNTIWTKNKGEENGILEVYVGDIIKYFVAPYRSVALRRAKSWLVKWQKSIDLANPTESEEK